MLQLTQNYVDFSDRVQTAYSFQFQLSCTGQKRGSAHVSLLSGLLTYYFLGHISITDIFLPATSSHSRSTCQNSQAAEAAAESFPSSASYHWDWSCEIKEERNAEHLVCMSPMPFCCKAARARHTQTGIIGSRRERKAGKPGYAETNPTGWVFDKAAHPLGPAEETTNYTEESSVIDTLKNSIRKRPPSCRWMCCSLDTLTLHWLTAACSCPSVTGLMPIFLYVCLLELTDCCRVFVLNSWV